MAPLVLPYSSDTLESRIVKADEDDGPSHASDPVNLGLLHSVGSPGSAVLVPGPQAGRMVHAANLLGHDDVPDVNLADFEWEISPTVSMALRGVIGGSMGNLESDRVGPLMAACLHTLVAVGAREAKWTREQATTDVPDYRQGPVGHRGPSSVKTWLRNWWRPLRRPIKSGNVGRRGLVCVRGTREARRRTRVREVFSAVRALCPCVGCVLFFVLYVTW